MKRETILTLLLAVLVVVALFQTFQLTGLKGQITANSVVVDAVDAPQLAEGGAAEGIDENQTQDFS